VAAKNPNLFLCNKQPVLRLVIGDATEALLFVFNALHHRILTGANILARLASRTTIHKSDVVLTASMILSNTYDLDAPTAFGAITRLVEAYGTGAD
jgi:hypothetical protein